MVKLLAVVVVLLALLGATGVYVNSGTTNTEASRRSQAADSASKDDTPISSNSLLLVGLGMIAVGVVGKRTVAGK